MDRVRGLLCTALLVGAAALYPAVVHADGDRWRPFIAEAAHRFGLPETWIRAVMSAESGGRPERDGRSITSPAGAMGLMQVMPGTYAAMRHAHGLGPDPHDPRDNILAGAAYLRAMYDRYGYPGLFAAYNAGPARYGEHLRTGRPLPAETQTYLATLARMPAASAMAPDLPSGSRLFFSLRTTLAAATAVFEGLVANALFVPLTTVPERRR